MSPWSPRFISSTNSGRRFDNIDIDWLEPSKQSIKQCFLSAQNHIKQQFRPPSSQRGRVCWAHWADAECSRPAVPSFHHSHLCLTRIRMWFQTRGILAARGYPKARPVMRARHLGMVCQDSPSCWGGPGRKRKHSNLIKHWSLPIGLPSGRESCVPSLSGGRMASSGLGVVGSHKTGGTLARKVISRRLSWDPTVKGKEEVEKLIVKNLKTFST